MPKLFESDTRVMLHVNPADGDGKRLRFPMVIDGDVPALVRVRSCSTGKTMIVGTGVWGNPNMPSTADAVKASASVLRKLQRSGEPAQTRAHEAKVRRARLADVLIHQRGLGFPIGLALLICLASIAGAVAAFTTSRAPAGVALVVLVLGCLAAVGVAIKSIREKLAAA